MCLPWCCFSLYFFHLFIFFACRHQAFLNLLLSSTERIVGHMGDVAGLHTARPIKINWEGFCHTSAAASQSCFHLQPPLREITPPPQKKKTVHGGLPFPNALHLYFQLMSSLIWRFPATAQRGNLTFIYLEYIDSLKCLTTGEFPFSRPIPIELTTT